jgi:hypothetical protein
MDGTQVKISEIINEDTNRGNLEEGWKNWVAGAAMGAAALGGNASTLDNKQPRQPQQSQQSQQGEADIRGMAEAALDVVSMHGDDDVALAEMGIALEQALKTNDLNRINKLGLGIFDYAKKHRMPTH